jgi:chromosome segregation ATPase
VQRLFDEAARLITRNEMLERQCENLIAELRESREKNDSFLKKLEKSKEDNDAMVAELRISKKQNESLIAELRETKKNNGMLSTKLENAIESIEGMKAQMSMMLSNFNIIKEQNQLGQLRVNDEGEPVIAIQIPNVVGDVKKIKSRIVPYGYIRGDVKVITELMVEQARAAFPPKKK